VQAEAVDNEMGTLIKNFSLTKHCHNMEIVEKWWTPHEFDFLEHVKFGILHTNDNTISS